jgi:hypothetical protein
MDEDGDLNFYHACVGRNSEPVNDVTRKVLSVHTIAGSVREFIAATELTSIVASITT